MLLGVSLTDNIFRNSATDNCHSLWPCKCVSNRILRLDPFEVRQHAELRPSPLRTIPERIIFVHRLSERVHIEDLEQLAGHCRLSLRGTLFRLRHVARDVDSQHSVVLPIPCIVHSLLEFVIRLKVVVPSRELNSVPLRDHHLVELRPEVVPVLAEFGFPSVGVNSIRLNDVV